MKKLTLHEVSYFSKYLDFSFTDGLLITNFFYKLKSKNSPLMRYTGLETVTDYIWEWENEWYRYNTWNALVESETETEGFTETECEEELNHTIFRIHKSLYIQWV